jgi:hypothetical protein
MLENAIGEGRLDLAPVDAEFIVETQAAGLRHRREGLAYRLSWMKRRPLRPNKRVASSAAALPLRRRLVFRTRAAVARWSHRTMWLARALGAPGLYLGWARFWLRLYQALAWSHGRLGVVLDRILPQPAK